VENHCNYASRGILSFHTRSQTLVSTLRISSDDLSQPLLWVLINRQDSIDSKPTAIELVKKTKRFSLFLFYVSNRCIGRDQGSGEGFYQEYFRGCELRLNLVWRCMQIVPSGTPGWKFRTAWLVALVISALGLRWVELHVVLQDATWWLHQRSPRYCCRWSNLVLIGELNKEVG
jgi:hypothetical protein